MADLISELVGKSDEDLMKAVGLGSKLKTIRDNLAEADKLSGEERKTVLKSLERKIAPSSYAFEDLEWDIKHAKQKAKTGCSPSEIVSCCCGD